MKICTNPNELIELVPRGVALGTFDGVHLGHEELLKDLVMTCRRLGLRPAVFTFSTHPEQVFSSGFRGFLMEEADRLAAFAALGIEEVFLFPLDESIYALSAEQFLNEWMLEKLDARIIFVGRDASFGAGRTGGSSFLLDWCRRNKREAKIVPDVRLGGAKISSTRIREELMNGRIESANRMLAHPYRLRGTVMQGRNLGHRFGVPTANFPMPSDRISIPFGVYAGRVKIQGQIYDAILNIGLSPTVQSGTENCRVEAHLLDFDGDLYGLEMEVDLLSYFREEKKFSDFSAMMPQIREDLEQARTYFRNLEDPVVRFSVGDVPAVFTHSKRFSVATATLLFRRRPNAGRITDFSLLMRILAATNEDFPSPSALLTHCTDLYGAELSAHVDKQGDVQTVGLTLSAWQDENGERVMDSALPLLFDCLLRPCRDDDGSFAEEGIRREKVNLEAELAARFEDRSLRAFDASLARLFPDSDHGQSAVGDRILLNQVGASELNAAYDELWNDCYISFYYAGQADTTLQTIVLQQLERLPICDGRPRSVDTWPTPVMPEPIPSFVMRAQTTQAQVVLQVRAASPWYSVDRYAQSLFIALLGGDERSFLFQEVRERLGLAYEVYAFNVLYSGVTVLFAGTFVQTAEDAKEAMLDKLLHLGQEALSDERLKLSKDNLKEKIRRSVDSAENLLGGAIAKHIYGRAVDVESRLLLQDEAGLEDIFAAANKSVPLQTFMLLPPEDDTWSLNEEI